MCRFADKFVVVETLRSVSASAGCWVNHPRFTQTALDAKVVITARGLEVDFTAYQLAGCNTQTLRQTSLNRDAVRSKSGTSWLGVTTRLYVRPAFEWFQSKLILLS